VDDVSKPKLERCKNSQETQHRSCSSLSEKILFIINLNMFTDTLQSCHAGKMADWLIKAVRDCLGNQRSQ